MVCYGKEGDRFSDFDRKIVKVLGIFGRKFRRNELYILLALVDFCFTHQDWSHSLSVRRCIVGERRRY